MVIQQGVWEKPKALEIPQKQIEWPKVLEMVPIVKNMLAVYHRLLRVIHREGNSHKEIKFKNQKRYHHRIHQFPRQSDQPRQLLPHLKQGRKEYFHLYYVRGGTEISFVVFPMHVVRSFGYTRRRWLHVYHPTWIIYRFYCVRFRGNAEGVFEVITTSLVWGDLSSAPD